MPTHSVRPDTKILEIFSEHITRDGWGIASMLVFDFDEVGITFRSEQSYFAANASRRLNTHRVLE